jgi:hypothetical protein
MSLLTPIVEIFRYGLEPVAPFSWFGIKLSTLEIAAAVRLCMILRQVRELISKGYQTQAQPKEKGRFRTRGVGGASGPVFETKSFVRDLSATLLVVHGGEITGASFFKYRERS